MDYKNKKVAVIGLGVSNTPLIEYLSLHGAKISVFDRKEAEKLQKFIDCLQNYQIEFFLGEDYLEHLVGFDIVFVAPGIRKNLPEFERALAEGAVFSSEMEVFLNEVVGHTIGITGSSGKTTTTTLVGKMIEAEFGKCYVGGNIGRSLLNEITAMNDDSHTVLELSSFQLQVLRKSPQIALITNITPNHLDMHASMEEYIEAKSNILRFQTDSDIAVLNYDDPTGYELKSLVKGKFYCFSRRQKLSEGAFLDGTKLLLKFKGKTEIIADRSELKLLGDHNVENILAAALLAYLSGVSIAKISEVAKSFIGVEHRLENAGELDGVTYYNDSISTTPNRAIAGIKAMTKPTVLIAGGYDKHLPFDEMAMETVKRCKTIVVLGNTKPLIVAAIRKADADFPIIEVDSFEAAVEAARRAAIPGDVVLLSPACASYDMFDNYQQRGKLFKEMVKSFK